MFLISSWVAAVPMLLGLGLQIPFLSDMLVATPPLLQSVILSVLTGGSLKDTRSGVLTVTEFTRFILLLESNSLISLTKILFQSTFYDSRRCRVPFIGHKALNGSVEFIHYSYIFANSTSDMISTRNIFVHSWGKYPTMIWPTCSNYTCRVYVPITCQKGFNKRCEHERLRLLFVKQKRITFDRHLSMVRDQLRDDVAIPSMMLWVWVPPITARYPPCQ